MDKKTMELAKKHGLKKEDLWFMKHAKKWAITHKAMERIAMDEKITIVDLDLSFVDLSIGSCVVKCTAVKDGLKVITFGEATPKNSHNAYPTAMAEKRSIDRAVLKLAGMHGDFYSEDEIDSRDSQAISSDAKNNDRVSGNGSSRNELAAPQEFNNLQTDEEKKNYVIAIIKKTKNTHRGNLAENIAPYQNFIEGGKYEQEITKAYRNQLKILES
tara:strand:+ start:1004 stop:1648 length:645 start_codon:yes stop_codon:yes gene_type:complete